MIDGLSFKIEENLITFNGDCDECKTYCRSCCCRIYEINLTTAEAKSGKYEVEKKYIDSYVLKYVMKKIPSGNGMKCIYLGRDFKCKIYDDRPNVCRVYECKKRSIPLKSVDNIQIRKALRNKKNE
jgi:Fe-S-cluster containining protein